MNTRTEKLIKELVSDLQLKAEEFLRMANGVSILQQSYPGMTIEIVEAKRDPYYQAGLWSIGRFFDREAKLWRILDQSLVVTNTLTSKHIEGKAFDIALWDGEKYHWPEDNFFWSVLANCGSMIGLKCGYYWKKKDMTHYEI